MSQLSYHPAEVTLGPRTRQLNGDQLYPITGRTSNQLATMTFLGMFDTDPDTANLGSIMTSSDKSDLSASLEDRARSYLDANAPAVTGRGIACRPILMPGSPRH